MRKMKWNFSWSENKKVAESIFGILRRKTETEEKDTESWRIMANHRHNEDSYCTRALTSEYNNAAVETGGGGTTGVARQRHRLGPSLITPTSRSTRSSSNQGSCFLCCGQVFNVLLRFRADSDELEQRYKSREIDKFLKKDKPTLRKQVSRLLEGCFFLYIFRIVWFDWEPQDFKKFPGQFFFLVSNFKNVAQSSEIKFFFLLIWIWN